MWRLVLQDLLILTNFVCPTCAWLRTGEIAEMGIFCWRERSCCVKSLGNWKCALPGPTHPSGSSSRAFPAWPVLRHQELFPAGTSDSVACKAFSILILLLRSVPSPIIWANKDRERAERGPSQAASVNTFYLLFIASGSAGSGSGRARAALGQAEVHKFLWGC